MAMPVCAAPPATPQPSVVDALCERCETVIGGELARLARRSPALGERELEVVSTSIRLVVERLLLDRVRERPSDHLATLFDLEEAL